jgi:hypothetical protein
MQSINLNVEQFLSYVASPTGFIDAMDSYRSPIDYERNIMLVWPDESGIHSSRPLIVVKESYVREFLAFANTYVKTYSPFTAFFRVMAEDRFQQMYDNTNWAPGRGGNIPHELVGVVMAEAFAQLGSRVTNVNSIPLQACQATLSMSLLEYLHTGCGASEIEGVAENWIQTKRIFAHEDLSLPYESVAQFWQIIASVFVEPGPLPERTLPYSIRDALESFMRKRELTALEWGAICESEPRLLDYSTMLLGSREERVQSFDQIVSIVQSSKKLIRSLQDIVLGAAASFVASGSLNYFSLIRGIGTENPAAILWFAFFASMHRKSDVFTVGDTLGRHLENRLFINKSIFDRPLCDISLDELYISGINKKGLKFRTLQPSSVVVEIAPLVHGKFRVGKSAHSSESPLESTGITQERWAEIKYLSDRLTRAIYGPSADQAPSEHYVPKEKYVVQRDNVPEKQNDFFETRPKSARRTVGTKRAK